ncbi:MAG: hypothetical protein COC11_03130 [Candidatus Neomarinimicrobiota bacterium]|jgi:hypothetical protein|nr:MAG: hypothetical protein COC11_03130 [Candidatus Neomarinimicrobiota bacterium]
MKLTTVESRAKKLVKEWAPRLGLENWDITIKAVPTDQITREAHMSNVAGYSAPLGCCHASAVDMSAVILLNADAKWSMKLDTWQSLPVTVVHELLHAFFESTGVNSAIELVAANESQDRDFSQGIWMGFHPSIERIAQAMLLGQ